MFLPIHLHIVFFLLPDVPRFLFSVGRNSLSHSFRIDLLVMILLVFFHLGDILISSSFLKDIFTGYRILGRQFSFSS